MAPGGILLVVKEEDVAALLREGQWVRRLAVGLVGPDQADDVVQETMLSTLRHPPPASRPLRPWLARVARNVVRMNHRAGKRRRLRDEQYASEDKEGGADAAALLDRLTAQRMLADHLAELPEPFRSTLLKRYYDEKCSREIAEDLDVPDGTVRWRIKRGLELLRARLREKEGRGWRRALLPLVPALPSEGLTTMAILKAALVLVVLLLGTAITVLVVQPSKTAQARSGTWGRQIAAHGPGPTASEPQMTRRQRLLAALQNKHPRRAEGASGGSIAARRPPTEIEAMLGLDPGYVRRQVLAVTPLLDECYENARATNPALAGTLTIELSIIGDQEVGGLIEESRIIAEKSTITDDALNECVTETLYAVELEPPFGGGRLVYRAPVYFPNPARREP